MSFFVKSTSSTQDPFLDALVSLSSDDPYTFVSASVLRNTDIYSAINIIAADIAGNPIQTGIPIWDKTINQTPNSNMSGYAFKFALAASMLLNGNSFAWIKNNHTLVYLPNNKVTVQQDDVSGKLAYTYSPDGRTKQQIAPDSILHFKYFAKDGSSGISPLYALKDVRQIANAGNKLLAGFFNQGIHGTTVVKLHQTDLSPDAKENIRKQFDSATTGGNALNTIVTSDDMDISNLSINTDVLKLVNSNDWTTRQVAEAFQLPVERLGLENEHSNTEQSNIQYLKGTLQHYFDCFTSELAFKLNVNAVFNTDNLLSLDPQDQQAMATAGYSGGILTRNEARSKLGLPPTDDGNVFVNINKNGAESSEQNG
ncbi:MAG: phage portal protein [Liquorilactobacillus nagelii]|uniref:phage portal protein n=1 Tax=Liquorilactobacillus nagelii TaxID=82688 RepID=UPI00242CAC41|nr:phage portal protein [Liquorilactobacillus nagelii]MCI1633692.1 phage portal protein [Liquorilactobacillus nagelii]